MYTDPISLLSAALSDRYTIEREIGRGGMATVWLARDLRHERNVALKLLNPELGAVLGVERFLSEIRVTANLQHPNLLPLFDSGEVAGQLFYVMPYVEGESLRARLDREKQLPVDEAVRLALSIANALDYAHAQNVIHRDLKPENILLQHGEPVIADFGIALAVSRAGGNRVTQTGLSLGTPQYMSPEQAGGDRAIDGRSDIYSLGAVLYEMLGGEAPHTGSTGQAIIAKLMTEEPRALTALRRSVPAHVAAAVHRALAKIPADRWRSARDFAEALRGARTMDTPTPMERAGARATGRAPRWIGLAMGATAGIVIGAGAMMSRQSASPALPTLRFNFVTTDSERFVPTTPAIPFSISPDDRRVVYVGAAPVGRRLYVRGLDDMLTRALPGTDGSPRQPTFSPDGKWIAFVKDDRIAKTPAEGGQVLTMLPLNGNANAGMHWVDADTIIASIGNALTAVPVNGGGAVTLSRPDTARGETAQWGPRVVNKRFVAYVSIGFSGMMGNRLAVLDRRTGRTIPTDVPCTTVLSTVDDRIFWVTPSGTVMVAAVNGEGKLGPSQLVLEDVLVRPGGAAKAALSPRGTLIYHRGISVSRLVSVDAQGLATPIVVEPRAFSHPRWSPDGTLIAVTIARSGGTDVWIVGVRSGVLRKLTPPEGSADQPEWSGDGKQIVFRYRQPSGTSIRQLPVDGGAATVLVDSVSDPYGARPSADGKWLVLAAVKNASNGGGDLAYAQFGGSRKPTYVASVPGFEYTPALSPDNKWLLYAGTQTGRPEVQVRPFPVDGTPVQLSTAGGYEALWGRDGRSVFYRLGRDVMAARLSFTPAPTVSETTKLFSGDFLSDPGYSQWDVAADGKHFLMLLNADSREETIVIYNWADELRRGWKK